MHKNNINFVPGHSLYMTAVHGSKTKNDKIDLYKVANLLRGGNFPPAYACPSEWRGTRYLPSRRMYFTRRAGELVAQIQNDNTRYNFQEFKKKLTRKYNRDGVSERFEDPEVRKRIEVDLEGINALKESLKKLNWHIEKTARRHDYHKSESLNLI